jgi:hypothetical protein
MAGLAPVGGITMNVAVEPQISNEMLQRAGALLLQWSGLQRHDKSLFDKLLEALGTSSVPMQVSDTAFFLKKEQGMNEAQAKEIIIKALNKLVPQLSNGEQDALVKAVEIMDNAWRPA